jgi:hypothetical protein
MALWPTYDAANNGLKSVVTRLTEPTALKLTSRVSSQTEIEVN